jgi:hypothetical protein
MLKKLVKILFILAGAALIMAGLAALLAEFALLPWTCAYAGLAVNCKALGALALLSGCVLMFAGFKISSRGEAGGAARPIVINKKDATIELYPYPWNKRLKDVRALSDLTDIRGEAVNKHSFLEYFGFIKNFSAARGMQMPDVKLNPRAHFYILTFNNGESVVVQAAEGVEMTPVFEFLTHIKNENIQRLS